MKYLSVGENFEWIGHIKSTPRSLLSRRRLLRTVTQNRNLPQTFERVRSFPVFVLVVPPGELRSYMLVAHSLGMTRGDFAFIQVDSSTDDRWMQGNATWWRGDAWDDDARDAMETVFWVSWFRTQALSWFSISENFIAVNRCR